MITPMAEPLRISVEPTADPDAVIIAVNRELGGQGRSYYAVAEAAGEPLAQAVLAIRGVREVSLRSSSLIVRKAPSADWQSVGPAIQAKVFQLLG